MSYILENVRVLDFSRLLPGPYATEILVDFGAEVIKIEDPIKGDYLREYETQPGNLGFAFATLNNGKKSIALDIRTEEGYSTVIELIKSADILVESFRPGVMKKLGLDYEKVCEIKQDIIYCSISGFGQKGDYAQKAGHDLTYLSYSGLLDIMIKNNFNLDYGIRLPEILITDLSASMNAITSILIAYINKLKTGNGQYIDISILDGIYRNCMPLIFSKYFSFEEIPNYNNNLLYGAYANYAVYETKDKKFLSVAAIEEKFWEVFCRAINRPSFINLLDKKNEMKKIKSEIQEIISKKNLDEWVEIMEPIDACVAPVLNMGDLSFTDDLIKKDLLSKQGILNNPVKFSTIKKVNKKKVPTLGNNNFEMVRKEG